VGYVYDTSGRLSTVTDANSGVTTFTYDTQNRMLTIQDPRLITYLTNQYDAAGRVMKQTNVDTGTWLFSWTPTTNVSQSHFYSFGGGGGAGTVITQSGCWSSSGINRSDPECQEGYLPLVAQVDVTDPRGFVRRVVLGSTGYITSDTYALGQPEQQTFTYSYFSDNLLAAESSSASKRQSQEGACLAKVEPRASRLERRRVAIADIAEKIRFHMSFREKLLLAGLTFASRKELLIESCVVKA
jgi:YD repeat-containing protein